ncbi:AraC family transcriptional regulator [Cytobacillus purgationiresistens]|uniref:AraC family transcriptional regulator n=1 Tax=Cytobacillus purgationiresistens TaxID=863449 RepID=A0ABU0AMK9_9BACI|nr:AraC family transcriptional regulator [Cytobacillus purgationiresistens]MDQ0272477.1 AraC family transcriptional regulator [Cytobacillus purgationiresistens]
MAWLQFIQTAIDYMEEHLLEDLDIEEVAKQAGSSSYHFQRTFALLTDCSVSEYLRRRRLSLAAKELSETNERIIDIAYKYGYDTPEAFSKAFRRQHDMTPTEARKFRGRQQFFERLVIQVTLKGAEPVKFNVVEKGKFNVIGMKRNYSLENGENLLEIPKLWNEVNSNGTIDKLCRFNNGHIKGVLGVCVDQGPDLQEGKIDYWIAVETTDGRGGEFQTLEIPASKWVVFEVKGPMPEAMQTTWKKIFSEWFPTSGYEHAGTPEMEVYPEDGSDTSEFYSEIWIPVK